MRDIRLIQLMQNPVESVSSVAISQYRMSSDAVALLEQKLCELDQLSYWHPKFQAWYPLVKQYLLSGVNPELTGTWAEQLASKLTPMEPPATAYSNILRDVYAYYRTNAVELFAGVTWLNIMQFVAFGTALAAQARDIRKVLRKPDQYKLQMEAMVQKLPLSNPEFDELLLYAIYLHGHSTLDFNYTTREQVAHLQTLVDRYIVTYEEEFQQAAKFCAPQKNLYPWYTDRILQLVKHAWSSSLELGDRVLLTPEDVYGLPVSLAENVSNYVNNLPCTMSVSIQYDLILRALEYAMNPNHYMGEPNMIWFMCIYPDRFTRMIDVILDFCELCNKGEVGPALYERACIAYSESDGKTVDPDKFSNSLKARGFPM